MSLLKRLIVGFLALALLLLIMPTGFAAEKPLYTALTSKISHMRAESSDTAKIVARIPEGKSVEIYDVDPEWVKVRYKGDTGYIKRTCIHKVTPIDPVNTPPYGVFKHTYMAVTADVTPVLQAPKADTEVLITLQAGAKISILDITDGWARIPFKRIYAYVDTRLLKDLTPVSPTDVPVSGETPIAAFTSFYNVKETKANIGRMTNIKVACERLSRVIAPGEELNFNEHIGPYNASVGYKQAPVLSDGGLEMAYGGGTCQVSSTFYNTLLQLPHITVLQRRPHGALGIYYLPHGVDAAVGNDSLNLRIRNDYDFPILVEASAQDGALFMCIWKQ